MPLFLLLLQVRSSTEEFLLAERVVFLLPFASTCTETPNANYSTWYWRGLCTRPVPKIPQLNKVLAWLLALRYKNR